MMVVSLDVLEVPHSGEPCRFNDYYLRAPLRLLWPCQEVNETVTQAELLVARWYSAGDCVPC